MIQERPVSLQAPVEGRVPNFSGQSEAADACPRKSPVAALESEGSTSGRFGGTPPPFLLERTVQNFRWQSTWHRSPFEKVEAESSCGQIGPDTKVGSRLDST